MSHDHSDHDSHSRDHHGHDHHGHAGHAHDHGRRARPLPPPGSLLRASAAARLAVAGAIVAVVWGGVFWAVS